MNARHLAVRGYCDLTDVVADHGCVLGRTKGNWQDVPNRSACLSLCASCASCNFASYGHDASGPAKGDCSWFQHCDKLSRELSRSHRTYTVRRNGSLVDLPALNAALDRVNPSHSHRTQPHTTDAMDKSACSEACRACWTSVAAKLLACDPCIAAAGIDRLPCVYGQLSEPGPA